MSALFCDFNRSTQHPHKTAALGFRFRGTYKAVQRAGAATDSGERAGSSKNRLAPETVVCTGDPGCRGDQITTVATDTNSASL